MDQESTRHVDRKDQRATVATSADRTDAAVLDRSTVLALAASCSTLASSLPNAQLQLLVADVLRPSSSARTVDAAGDGPPCPTWTVVSTRPRLRTHTLRLDARLVPFASSVALVRGAWWCARPRRPAPMQQGSVNPANVGPTTTPQSWVEPMCRTRCPYPLEEEEEEEEEKETPRETQTCTPVAARMLTCQGRTPCGRERKGQSEG